VDGESSDRRRAVAQRNVTAILDAAEALIRAHAPVTIAGVASAAGVSRVTVYAHFATAEAVLEAVVARAVGHAGPPLPASRPAAGPALAALERLLVTGWRELGQHAPIAQAASMMLSADAMARSHQAAYREVADLVERGRREGAFRGDVPADWLVTCCFALIHACADEVRGGRMDPAEAEQVLVTTVRDLFTSRPES
jgi:AcrR family transcriptional regulator